MASEGERGVRSAECGSDAPPAASPSAVRSPRGGTVAAVRAELTSTLEVGGVPLAAQEARDMLAVLLDVPRLWPTVHPEALVPDAVCREARLAARRRVAGAPFAYAVGRASFRHLTLHVDPRVLIPRQETELLPELVLALMLTPGGTAVDVGTGSGALAFALATDGRFERVIATDVSLDALAVARRNAVPLGDALCARVEFRHGAGLAPVAGERARVIVANPPYIAFEEMAALPPSVRDWEPAVALCCGRSGLGVTAAIVRDAARVLEPGGVLALEVDVRRASLVAEQLASDARYHSVAIHLDLAGRERFVVATTRPVMRD